MRRVLSRRLGLPTVLLISIQIIFMAPFNRIMAQQQYDDLIAAPLVRPGAGDIPAGTVLILEMDDRLDSKTSRIGDKFRATVAVPVLDGTGRAVLQQGTVVEGHVINAEPAKWRHRSGIIGIAFDNLWFGDGSRTRIQGYLTSADPRDRKRIDEEGNIRARGSTKKSIVFIGGGAGAGAAIGVLTAASLLAATGVGAAIGVTAALLIKGEDVVVPAGQRFGLELTQPLRPGLGNYNDPARLGYGEPSRTLPVRSRFGTPTSRYGYQQDPYGYNSNNLRTVPGTVGVYDVRAERRNGLVIVFITAETPTRNWQIYTHHEVIRGDTLEVKLRGVPLSGSGTKQLSRVPAPTIIVQEANAAIRNVVVSGSNGSRTIRLDFNGGGGYTPVQPIQSTGPYGNAPSAGPYSNAPYSGPVATPYVPSSQTPYVAPPLSGPSDGSSIYFPPSSGGPTRPVINNPPIGGATRPPVVISPPINTGGVSNSAVAPAAQRAYNQLQVMRENYAASIGGFRNPDGSYEFLGARKPTAPEKQFLDGLGYLLESLNGLRNANTTTAQRRTYAQHLRDDYQVTSQNFAQVRPDASVSQQWQALQRDLSTVIDAANR